MPSPFRRGGLTLPNEGTHDTHLTAVRRLHARLEPRFFVYVGVNTTAGEKWIRVRGTAPWVMGTVGQVVFKPWVTGSGLRT